jgi:V8-like Glu-specific endopeptidase
VSNYLTGIGYRDFDFAVAELDIAPGYTGWPGWFGTEETRFGIMGMAGYPNDKGSPPFAQQQMWLKSGTLGVPWGAAQYLHRLDTAPGDGGACIYNYPHYRCVAINTEETISANKARRWDALTDAFVGANSSAW